MTETTLQTPAATEGATNALSTVQAFFNAMAARDIETVAGLFSDDATWNHRNEDRFGGVHRGRDAILAFIGESVQLTGGTLRPMPQAFLPDGGGRVAALVRLTATRPDGRSADDLQMVLFAVTDGRVTAVEHFLGDPAGQTAFWA